jgi:hypothetical protein
MSRATGLTETLSGLKSSPASAGRGWAVARLCLVPATCYYAFLLSAGGGFLSELPHGLTFNSMLLHVIAGRFDVDPATIGDEGFIRDGATYAYFGVLPALLRAPFLGMRNFATIDFTRLSCLVAVLLMASFKIEAALLVGRRAGGERAPLLLVPLVAAILLCGPQIEFLRPSIFQEAAFWAAACAAAFVYLFVRGWLGEAGFTGRVLAGMALAAGICLLARVSTALGLYLALGFLWVRLLWESVRAGALRRDLVKFAVPAAVVCGFAVLTGLVNQQRWGNALVFVDLSRQIIAQTRFPDRLARVHEYGEFNPARVVYALGYYFLPLWALRDGAGELLWSAFQQRMFDFVELPPGSILVSSPLLLGLAGVGITQLARRSLPRPDQIVLVLGGLFVPIGLMLTAIALTYRYRLEFYPFIELCAFAGFAWLTAAPSRGMRLLFATATILGIIIAHAMWVLYMLSPLGPAAEALGAHGVVGFYSSLFP